MYIQKQLLILKTTTKDLILYIFSYYIFSFKCISFELDFSCIYGFWFWKW